MQNHSAKTGGRSRFRFDRLEERIAPSAMAAARRYGRIYLPVSLVKGSSRRTTMPLPPSSSPMS